MRRSGWGGDSVWFSFLCRLSWRMETKGAGTGGGELVHTLAVEVEVRHIEAEEEMGLETSGAKK